MSTPAIRERFARDDLPHRLGALAANLLRVETFCRRAGSLELARRVMEESKFFIEWSARNAPEDSAAQLAQLQLELILWVNRWGTLENDQAGLEALARWASIWAERVLELSGLRDSAARTSSRSIPVPRNHKFAALALHDVWHQIEHVETSAGAFTRSVPIVVDEFWRQGRGQWWAESVSTADIYLVVTAKSVDTEVQDDEDRELVHRCQLLRYGLAIASRHFRCGRGIWIGGACGNDGPSQRTVAEEPGLHRHPEARMIQLTEPDFLLAGRYAMALHPEHPAASDRLIRSTQCFVRGLESRSAVERIHQFVRCVEGVVRPRKGNTQKDFVYAAQSILTVDHQRALSEMFEIRSADEHLNDPADEIPGSSPEAKNEVLLRRAAEAEAIARAFLAGILENPDLRARRFPADPSAITHWSDSDRQLWRMPIDLDQVVLDMTTRS